MGRIAVRVVVAILLAGGAGSAWARSVLDVGEARILRNPDVSATHVAFVHANDIWIAPRAGGEARRLTTFPGAETEPHFSPDGRWVAFSGEYDGNVDVYVVPVEGGEPRRLTWHPYADAVRGWTPDGKRIVFASGRINAPRPWPRFWTVPPEGGMPEPMPLNRVAEGKLSPDGRRLAYQRVQPFESEWRNYRGGQAQPIRIVDLESLEVRKLPWEGSNDLSPVWVGHSVFFLSDRDGMMNVWEFDTRSETLRQRTRFTLFDCKKLESGPDTLIFENGGYLYTLPVASGEAKKLVITLRGDFPWARPHFEDVTPLIRVGRLSPTGKRAVFEARGEIFTVPAEKGDIRNLSRSSGSAEREPAWSPDGAHVAWFSDAGGEYALVIADQRGGDRRVLELPDPTFYYTPAWSPDSKWIAYGDADRNLWVLNVDSGETRKVDNEGFAHPQRVIAPAWSPDSKWIAYTKRLKNQFATVFVYSMEDGSRHAVTDGLAYAHSPAWDPSGKYLYFLASTDYGLNVGWLDLSSFNVPYNHAIYAAVLSKDLPSPLAPESDDETPKGEKKETDGEDKENAGGKEAKRDKGAAKGEPSGKKKKGEKKTTPEVRIDFDGLDQRIIALNVPPRPYSNPQSPSEGVLFYTERVPHQQGLVLRRYDFKDRKAEKVLSGILGYTLSADGKKMLYAKPRRQFYITDAGKKVDPSKGRLNLSDMKMKVDPRAEWKQIFREAWRFQRDYFYVENHHGLDLDWAYEVYAPWVEHVRHRDDLTYVLDILGGEMSVGHSYTGGGDVPEVERIPVGLLGADFDVDEGRYRIRRIYTAEHWNPDLKAPLSGPGLDVREGEYLIAVNGEEVRAGDNLYRFFERTAGRQVILEIHDRPKREGAREVTVVPVASEVPLRLRAWVEDNRRKVDELSDGRLAYVWVPDTAAGGHRSFTRYYFAQMDKKGAIIDERFNHGGQIADYIVDLLSRELLGYFNNPVGDKQPWTAPNAAIWGPKVMLINEMSGSGGDMLPYMFRKKKIGPLVGTRTWGGLVGIWDVPALIDGGFMTSPRGGFYSTEGRWEVENEGVAPDVEVEQDPKARAEGRDPQLERAVAIALERLATEGIELLPQPPDPVRVLKPRRR